MFCENFPNFRNNEAKIVLFDIKLYFTLTYILSGLWKKNFFYHLLINSSIFDQACKDIPGQPR